MSSYLHPASLNEFQRYKQAGTILKKTSRASQPDWYQPALALENQLHLRIDGASLSSFYYSARENAWGAAPALTQSILGDPNVRDAWITGIIEQARNSRAKSLGVVLHIADEFATAELKPEYSHHENLSELQQAAINDPAAILADSAANQASWRFIPYDGGSHSLAGTTIHLSHAHADFLQAFRTAAENENFPIVTQALSAPLVALKGLGASLKPTPGKPFVAILQYPWFTAMAFFNAEANLVLIRSLQHRGQRRPNNFRQALLTTNAALEFIEPDLYLLPLSPDIDPTLIADLKLTFPNNRVEEIQLPSQQELPIWAAEPPISSWGAHAPSRAVSGAPPETSSLTFSRLASENWATQDFLPEPRGASEVYPSQGEMKLLRGAKFFRYALGLLAFLTFGWIALGAIRIFNDEAWNFKPSTATALQQKTAKLNQEKQKSAAWDNLLADRSKAWVEMEALARLAPPDSGLKVKSYSYSAKPDSTSAATGKKGAANKSTAGIVREWKISGSARENALDFLNSLNNRDAVSAHFMKIAKLTGNESYRTDLPTRSLVINIKTAENSSFKAPATDLSPAESTGESNYPFTFDMTITQRFEATDPMALNTTKAP
ncbi:MAG: hypothetical protein QM680_12240 [Luteolibacter sp.]